MIDEAEEGTPDEPSSDDSNENVCNGKRDKIIRKAKR